MIHCGSSTFRSRNFRLGSSSSGKSNLELPSWNNSPCNAVTLKFSLFLVTRCVWHTACVPVRGGGRHFLQVLKFNVFFCRRRSASTAKASAHAFQASKQFATPSAPASRRRGNQPVDCRQKSGNSPARRLSKTVAVAIFSAVAIGKPRLAASANLSSQTRRTNILRATKQSSAGHNNISSASKK